jgi:Aromatic acid exporter family member 1
MLFASLYRIRSTRPALWHITRLTATATFAYLLALLIPAGTSRPVLAPLTALLVLQASLYQTIRSAMRKVLSVTVGVLVAVFVAEFIGFSWWQLALVIGGALVIGRALRLGDDLLEVPISAMLIFSSVGTHAAATGRVVDTLMGAGAGLGGGLVFAGRPQVQPARSAVGHLAGEVAGLLDRMAADLAGTERADTEPVLAETELADTELANIGPEGSGRGSADPADDDLTTEAGRWLVQARALRDEIERVDDTLREAADSARLNPRALVLPAGATPVTATTVALRGGLEALEHAALTLRGLARSVLDSAEIATEASPVRDKETRVQLASVLAKLGEAIRTYGRLVQLTPVGSESLESELAAELDEAHRLQDELADLLKPRAKAGRPSEWPLRGEILAHVDRLRTGLDVEAIHRASPPPARRRRRPATGSQPRARSLRRVVSRPRTPRA